jgi:hypothetical protein
VIGAPVVKGDCWICESAIADSGEHKSKKSDLKAVFGDVSPQRPIYFHQGESRNRGVQSLDASRLKWTKVICGCCNSARTQPHDMAWDTLHAGLRKRVPSLKPGDRVRGNSIFRHDTARAMVNVHLYFAKAFGCTLVMEDAPLDIAPFAKAIMTGTRAIVSVARDAGLGLPTDEHLRAEEICCELPRRAAAVQCFMVIAVGMLAERHGGVRALARAMARENGPGLEATVRRWLALGQREFGRSLS